MIGARISKSLGRKLNIYFRREILSEELYLVLRLINQKLRFTSQNQVQAKWESVIHLIEQQLNLSLQDLGKPSLDCCCFNVIYVFCLLFTTKITVV